MDQRILRTPSRGRSSSVAISSVNGQGGIMNRCSTALGLAVLATAALLGPVPEARPAEDPAEGSSDLLSELRDYPHKLVYETNRDGNWELYVCNADGSNPVNVTRTPDVD